ASDLTKNSVKLSWKAATDDKGVKNYDVLRDGAKVATVTATTFTDQNLAPGTDYSYSVQARDTVDQTGPVSAPVKVTTPGDGTGPGPGPREKINLGYFTEWGVYGRNYHVKNLVTSGSAEKITHINYSFGNVQGGKCTIGDSFAAYDKAYTAAESVDGVADTWDQPLRGNFNQLRKLKAKYPHIKVLWSFGGWTWSGGFTDAVKNPAAFAKSCHDLVEDPRWADVFDGIDLDWEYPNACGLSCDSSGPAALKNMVQAMRAQFGTDLVTAAITADASSGGKLDAADYAGAAQYFDWYNVMTYDFFGAWDKTGPTAPHSALNSYSGIPKADFHSAAAIAKLKAKGVPASKLLLGIGFYGRGWTGVTQDAPGGTATGPATGTYEAGIEDYKVLKNTCPATGTVGGTAYAKCGSNWWSYDTPATIKTKMAWAKDQGLGGAFFWEFSGDTAGGELVSAMDSGLR
ncbi:glycosyl hydrolase family 18 protein, partial [Streptomyces albidoflavus]|uniref:glycosyl hydrolase family 18 protein n=3 Tax=Streptomyces albidoflavus TaxID=1886 RepID=UPI000BADFF0C